MSTTTAPAESAPAQPLATELSGKKVVGPLVTMLTCAAAEVVLAVYQWMELLELNRGGVPVCNINSTVNCGAVWNSNFAGAVHSHLGVPVAGLGIVYGVTAFGLALLLAARLLSGKATTGPVAALRLWGAVGALSCITFAVATFQAGAVCLTCLVTYALTLGFFAGTVLVPGEKVPSFDKLLSGLPALLLLLGASYGAVLYPGLNTPKPAPPQKLGASEEQIEKYFETLPQQEALATAYARQQWMQGTTLDVSPWPVHHLEGPTNAPVKVVDFTDILCPHCAALAQTLDELKRAAPPGSFSVESRYFPLDGECNPNVQQSSGDGVRCLAAKVEICLENSGKFHETQLALFQAQNGLTPDRIMQIAERAVPKAELDQCVASPATASRLQEDIAYAMSTHPDGTPILLIDGRVTPPVRSFIYGMVMAKGDVNAKLFSKLPAAPAQ